MRSLICLGVAASLVAAGSGCRKKPAVPVAVKGKVERADGQPIKDLTITFHPADESNKHGRLMTLVLKGDGQFAGECLPGRYRVTLAPVVRGTGVGGPLIGGGAGGKGPGGLSLSFPLGYLKPDTTPWDNVVVPAGGADALVLTMAAE